MIDRRGVLDQVKAGKLSRAKAARMLGLSRQYIGKLVSGKGAAPMNSKPAPALTAAPLSPSPAPPAPAVATPTEPPPAAAGDGAAKPLSLAEILARAKAGAPGTPPQQPAAAPGAPPPPAAAPAIDPRDVEAANALIAEGQTFLVESIAVYGFGLKSTDPRLKEVQEPNAFMKIALKRNEDKTSGLGALAGGWKGLIAGVVLEIFRVSRFFRGRGVKPPAGGGEPPGVTEPEEEDDAPVPEVVDGGGFNIARAAEEARQGK